MLVHITKIRCPNHEREATIIGQEERGQNKYTVMADCGCTLVITIKAEVLI